MKDFFDLWVIAKSFAFDGAVLAKAVASTFKRRGTALPTDPPAALTGAFVRDAVKQAQWRGFLQRTTFAIAPEPLAELIALNAAFAMPLLGVQPAAPFSSGSLAVRGAP